VIKRSLAARVQDWILIARDMNLEILRGLNSQLPGTKQLQRGIVNFFRPHDKKCTALLTAEGWKLYDIVRDMESSVVGLLASALEGNSEAIVPLAMDLDPNVLINRFKLYWASTVFCPHEHIKKFKTQLRIKVNFRACDR
jgi:hypothetical protein